ncbi:restriction endonuclease subunit M [Pseudonocardia sp. TMWB2A]|uniref:Eco57I restriction-modification methylase domain-containing protein n=1 Tax=Pseudonocardia sp. TMWB2A TaxID=687430 RepID=UPI00307EEB2F
MTNDRFKPLLDRSFLRAELEYEFQDYLADGRDDNIKAVLEGWVKREIKRETKAEGSFTQRFFVEMWGYEEDGKGKTGFHLDSKFAVKGAGQTGGKGEADLAIGNFGGGRAHVPQILCEFKHMTKAGLDAPQHRKGNNRSPVQQAQDYLWGARRGVALNAPVQPRFAIVTDMNEFRLYSADSMPDRYLRFKIAGDDLFDQVNMLGNDEVAQFDRFLFWRMFQPDMLLSDAGRTRLERMVERQGKSEKKLEDEFYKEYRAYREILIQHIMLQRPGGMTKSGAVRLGQKLLDRLIFVMFAEDMGARVGFPTNELQRQLEAFSRDSMLEENGEEIWTRLKLVFARMNVGGDIGDHKIHKFNGGLFADDPAIDALRLPNHIFAMRGQAQNEAKINEYKATLLYLAATYNFAREGDTKNSIGLYTLGHIFEQSIVELEKLEAEADARPSLTDITKRKRDGVYYTPEWTVRRIIEETITPLFDAWKQASGWTEGEMPTAQAALSYWQRLQQIKIIDPACGSGAFLIVALKHLEREFSAAVDMAVEMKAIESRPEPAAITEMILANNIFGVDINPASVEITRLSLWLHTAQAQKPLSSLDKHIQCGNSLIDQRFYAKRKLYDDEERDRINIFEWDGDFASGTFDAVIGNPPYVKLQNFKQVNKDMAEWLSSGQSPYLSTRTGNFDLYLPFIEKGLELLNSGGRMGYIAPNLWPTLEYGAGLRGLIHAGRHLEKWLDFRSFQVFEEATVYTAIQIFTKAPAATIALAFADDGDISRVDWTDDAYRLPYEAITNATTPWLIAPAPVRMMIERLRREALPLGHVDNSKNIIVGIQTSADHIYHLRRLGRNRYAFTPKLKGKKQPDEVVELEDAIMKPLVSGAEVKRFLEPQTRTYLLFPYHVDAKGARLYTPEEMARDFPKAWAYLRRFEQELRDREKEKFNDTKWYRMGRTQNLDKQENAKLLVPRLVAKLGTVVDDTGRYYCDNVDVGGVIPARKDDSWFLSAILNAPVTNTIFQWQSKPFRGDYKSANKQFIAPLPVPNADRKSRATLTALAKRLQQQATERLRLTQDLEERLSTAARTVKTLDQLIPAVRSIPQIEEEISNSIPATNRKNWVDDQRKADEETALAEIDGLIHPASHFDVSLDRGKLSFLIDEREVCRLFVEDDEAELVLAQWRCIALDFTPATKGNGKKLVDRLRKPVTRADAAVHSQIIEISKKISNMSEKLTADETALHEMTLSLFNISPQERRLIEQ